ncbi:uncharacterized protein LOC126901810 [Daktulosphaira vitifoliae]|uniref:uncharacterized protein LOC126901810 n=1 Tax=Daktulosphaira vitifoliae TaxID=58002 RepID=UPI0021A9E9CF|nr:uncharacterized protein LOC126901810 [Daktulosphaira vitifoliae]
MIVRTCAVLLFILVNLLLNSEIGAQPGNKSICETCACFPTNVAPTSVNCTCIKNKFLIIRPTDASLLLAVKELTLAACGLVSLPPSGLPNANLLKKVTVRDIKLFHYTAGLFPVLETLVIENVDGLVLDGFGQANNTLKELELRRTKVQKFVQGTVPASAPLRKITLDSVEIEEIEPGALDMSFSHDKVEGFSMINSSVKTIEAGGVMVRSGSVKIVNSTFDKLHSGSIIVEEGREINLSGNKFNNVSLVGDSVTISRSRNFGDGNVTIDGNEFFSLPADLQIFKTDRHVTFANNIVHDVDLGPFLFGVGPTVRVSGNRFECDCDSRRTSVLKLNQVFPGLLSDDSYFTVLLAENNCKQPASMTLAGYRDELIAGKTCPGTSLPTAEPTTPPMPTDSPSKSSSRSSSEITMAVVTLFMIIFTVLPLS